MILLVNLLDTSDCLERVSDAMNRLSLECPNMSSIDLHEAEDALADLITRCECTVVCDSNSYRAITEMARFILETFRRVRDLKANATYSELGQIVGGGV
ncbi:hypothetical protein LCGC14_0318820 [marine sediment metagenome]|uniref:Uncharacterized protein n=1 Tax=marine sediment metagenome TaxID=412755 RepID=A0A0F9W7E9_9ZZZZ